MQKEKLLLFDTNSIIHRAFHALPPLKSKDGEPGGAVYGSLLAFFRIISEVNPQYVVAAFDSPGKTFRHEKYEKYKANRPKAPDELVSQIKKTIKVFSEIGVLTLAREGLEGDDIVGAVSFSAPSNVETVIATGDMDMLQLVNEKTKVYTLKKGIKESVLYDVEKVKERYDGIPPEKLVDVKALQGDPSDNIPGVEGIGEKTAIKIIKEFKDLESLYSVLEKHSLPGEKSVLSERIWKKLKENKEKAFLSKELSLIKKENFSGFNFPDSRFFLEDQKVVKTLEELGFRSIAKRFLNKSERETGGENLKLNL